MLLASDKRMLMDCDRPHGTHSFHVCYACVQAKCDDSLDKMHMTTVSRFNVFHVYPPTVARLMQIARHVGTIQPWNCPYG